MHLYMMTRGIKHSVDQFITELQGKYLPFKWRKDGDTKLEDYHVQLAVRPIQLWELVFPEECKDIILSTCLGGADRAGLQHPKHAKYIWALRKALGVDPIPEYDKTKMMPITRPQAEVIGIGIKKDYWVTKDGKHVAEKEDGAYEGL